MGQAIGTVTCTVIVPTYNRPAALARCLAGLAEQDYPRELWEVVVVDDGGAAALDGIIEEAAERMRVRLLRKEHRGPGHARNHGVRHAEGELIAFTDDDCKPEPNWLREFAAAHAADPDALLGGHTWNALPSDRYAQASQLLIDYLYSYYNLEREDAQFFTSNNMAVGRDAFLEVGGFDPLFRYAAGEDRELCARWRHLGRRLVYVPVARVAHAHALTMRTFLRQHVGYGRGAYYFRLREAERTEEGVKLEPPHFYMNMMRLPFHQLGWSGGLAAAGLLVLAQVGNAAGYYLERVRAVGERRRNPLSGAKPAVNDDAAVNGPDERAIYRRGAAGRIHHGRSNVRPSVGKRHLEAAEES